MRGSDNYREKRERKRAVKDTCAKAAMEKTGR